ncbi:protein SGT1 homolog [Anopheles maculipalpis]|uniref:protein SGT1 homolog n=1 Tax=Anopheles maculipalpis TaxID=1496333 RepID=UPI0021596242|nr:protein SGT1 homolog [Anopheles maculipalpis]
MAKVKYDWYQTDTAVTVTVLLKNATEKNYTVQLEQNALTLQADGIEPIALNLWNPINVEQSSHKASPSKVEIKLAKMIGQRWEALERKQSTEEPRPTSTTAKKLCDWDKISKEIENEDETKDDVNALFRKIFADANEDTRKAMMKSYYESGGTVLSTNWDEVGSKTVQVSPPDGCEFKKWN